MPNPAKHNDPFDSLDDLDDDFVDYRAKIDAAGDDYELTGAQAFSSAASPASDPFADDFDAPAPATQRQAFSSPTGLRDLGLRLSLIHI